MTMANPWIVIKFGGTSVSTEKNWRHILTIIRGHLAASRRVLVVCSAITHVSNKLEALLTAALVGEQSQSLAELEEIHLGTARFDLSFTMRPAPGGGMRCELEYSTDLFDPASIERLGRRFVTLLGDEALEEDVVVLLAGVDRSDP